MPPLSLDVRDAITIVTGILTIAGVVSAMRAGIAKLSDGQEALKAGQAEGNRKIDALHKRMDHYGERISKAEICHAVLTERVDNIRSTQRIRAARLEAAQAGEPPMFIEEGPEG